jgi:hypothetical protein
VRLILFRSKRGRLRLNQYYIIDALTKSANEMKSTFQTLVSGLRKMIRCFPGSPATEGLNRKVRYIASFDEVSVARDTDCARIEYKEAGIPVTHLSIGPGIARMSDTEIVEFHNDCLRNHSKDAAAAGRVALEVPLGSTQIKYFARSDQWVPRARVLRCLIQNHQNDQLVIKIDQQELRLKQFGKMLATYQGWGMRIEFVPSNEVHRRPALKVEEPHEI